MITKNPHTKANPHTTQSTYQSLSTYPYIDQITYVISTYNAPTTIGEETISNYENVLIEVNEQLTRAMDEMLR